MFSQSVLFVDLGITLCTVYAFETVLGIDRKSLGMNGLLFSVILGHSRDIQDACFLYSLLLFIEK